MSTRGWLLTAALIAAAALGFYGWKAAARRALLDEQRTRHSGYSVVVDPAQNAIVMRSPDGEVRGEPLERLLLLELRSSGYRKYDRDLAWRVQSGMGLEIPYFAVQPEAMLRLLGPRMPGLDTPATRALIRRVEREPDIYCVLWASPRYADFMGPKPPPVGCRDVSGLTD